MYLQRLFQELSLALLESLGMSSGDMATQEQLLKADVILVLGAGVVDVQATTGSTVERLRTAATVIERYPKTLLLSGGFTSPGNYSEAKSMEIWLNEHYPDLSAPRIILEQSSHNSIEEAIYSRPIIDRLNARNIIIITSDYHLKRALYDFDFVFGVDYEISGVPAISSESVREDQVLREELHLTETKIAFAGITKGDLTAIADRAAKIDTIEDKIHTIEDKVHDLKSE